MSEDVRSVLTADEWARELTEDLRQRLEWAASEAGASDAVSIPALAALALQRAAPGGGPLFTWTMVDALAALLAEHNGVVSPDEHSDQLTWFAHDAIQALRSLLPPRQP